MGKEIYLIITEDVEAYKPVEAKPIVPDFDAVKVGSTSLDQIFNKYDTSITKFVELDFWANIAREAPKVIESWNAQGHEIGLHIHFLHPAKTHRNPILELKKQPLIYDVVDKVKEWSILGFNLPEFQKGSKSNEFDSNLVQAHFDEAIKQLGELGIKPISFRAGAFRFSYEILRVMERYEFEYSSNLIPEKQYYKREISACLKPYWLSNDKKLWYHPTENQTGHICPEAQNKDRSKILEVPLAWHPMSRASWKLLNADYPFLLKNMKLLLKNILTHITPMDHQGPFFIIIHYHSWACGVKKPSQRFLNNFDELLKWLRGFPHIDLLTISEIKGRMKS